MISLLASLLWSPLTWLVLVLATIAGLIAVVRKLLRMDRTHAVLIAAAVIAAPVGACKTYERSVVLSFVPDALEVYTVDYAKEETWGFGPGGNEAGVRVYPLSEDIARQVDIGGLDFLEAMPQSEAQARGEWRGRYEDWKQTPIRSDAHWQPNKESGRMAMYDYVCAYGFCIDVDPDVVREIEHAVNEPGSYYAYGRIGVIVVSPRSKKVFYLYNG